VKHFLLVFISIFGATAFGGNFPSCPKGLVWDGVTCVSTCPTGFKWDAHGTCVKVEGGAAVCKKEDRFFESVQTGCLQKGKDLIFGRVSPKPLTAREARAFCFAIQAGKTDWRLPSPRELELVSGPTWADEHLDLVADAWYWTTETKQKFPQAGHGFGHGHHRHWGHHGHLGGLDDTYDVLQKVVNLSNGYSEFFMAKEVEDDVDFWTAVTANVVCVRNSRW